MNSMNLEEFDRDSEYEVINTHDNYVRIARLLFNAEKPVLIGWTDQMGTHYDILFTFHRYGIIGCQPYTYQGGISTHDLFVSVMRKGSFGFDVMYDHDTWLSCDYVAEKLNLSGGPTTEKVAELINGVILELKNPGIRDEDLV